MTSPCIICGSADLKEHLDILTRCVCCGHVAANIDPALLKTKDIYSPDYFQKGEYFHYARDRFCFEKNFHNRLKTLLCYRRGGRLLEIGAAAGFFLNLARGHFSTLGYEICEDMAAYARRTFSLDVRSSDFLTDALPEGHFDAVVMWDVIEHLVHPQDFIGKIHALLKDKGVLVLTTGDIGSFTAKAQGAGWRLIHPPTHIHYFSRRSMIRLLTKHGFEIVRVEYPGYWRSLRQIFYGLFPSHRQNASFLGLLDRDWFGSTAVYANLFDIMQIVAVKKGST